MGSTHSSFSQTCGAAIAIAMEDPMEAIVEKCCGLDVHQGSVVACALVGGPYGKPQKHLRTFKTVTRDLLALRDWLLELGCTHVAMESTGVYWKPIYYLLEGSFELIVGNARHIRNVPGRKTDVKDAEWIAGLARLGLIAKSFVPPPDIRELRDLLRFRTSLIYDRTRGRNELLKLLESANIKVSSVASNVFGLSGMLMLKALVEGTATAAQMAELAKGKLRAKRAELELALEGRVVEHHRYMLRFQMRRLEQVDRDIAELDAHIDQKLRPYEEAHTLLQQIPGVDRIVAATILAEAGPDMSVFKSSMHLASWAGVCPGSYESAGKHRGGRTRKGNVYLRTMLVQAAMAAARTKGTFLKDKYYRLKARRGSKRAALAIAHKILVYAYQMLSYRVPFHELGEAYLDQVSKKRVTKGLVKRLEGLGFRVELTKAA
jgi:transposase